MKSNLITRRSLIRAGLTGAASLTLAGCNQFDGLSDSDSVVRRAVASMNNLTYRAQRLLVSRDRLAPEFTVVDIRQSQHPNGSTDPDTEEYLKLKADNFASYRLNVSGLVDTPLTLSLDDLKALPSRTQITRHDCVEGWSCIGQWKGVRLSHLLNMAKVQPAAKFVVFHCLDLMDADDEDTAYYESVDMDDAFHEQTILAWELNGKPLPVANGAPLRARIERQLGYKQPKYLQRVELVAKFDKISGGKSGYWEDQGYNWYGGI